MCLSGIFCLFTILQYADFQQGKAIVIIISLLMIIGFGLAAIKCFKSIPRKNRTERNPETAASPVTETSADPPAPAVVPDTVPINEHSVEYIESENLIQRADNKPISDEEVPYLIQTGYERALERKNEQIDLNEQEQQFFDELKNALSKIQRTISMKRMSNGIISVYSNTYYVGKIKLTGRKHWMQILRGETQIKTIDGELDGFISHIPDWVRYINLHCK